MRKPKRKAYSRFDFVLALEHGHVRVTVTSTKALQTAQGRKAVAAAAESVAVSWFGEAK